MTEEAAEAPFLDASSSPRPGSARRSKPWGRSGIIISGGSGSSAVEYTSLRDVLGEDGAGELATPPSWRAGGSWGEPCSCCHDAGAALHDDADGIRNRLLRRAASAYMQSAAVVVAAAGDDRGCSCLARLCGGGNGGRGRGRGRVLARAACSPWQGCVDDPAEVCAAFLARSARRVAAFVAERVAGVWAW